jgi:hypothetical protein
MADVFAALMRVRREPFVDHLPIADTVNQLCTKQGFAWRDRLLTPLVTLRLFVVQVLHGNTSIAHLRQLSGMDFAPSSYSEARGRVPLHVFSGLLQAMAGWADRTATGVAFIGQRLFICDASSFSMSDTGELREYFGLPSGAGPGVGYLVAKLMGLMDAATGLFTRLLAAPLFTHDMRHVLRLHPALRAGDILLGDRAYCTYVHLALLQLQGVFGCFRLHQRRPAAAGFKRWTRQRKPPAWMNVLKCQSVEGVMKELAVYALVYNLVRLAMLRAAEQQRVSVSRISFVDGLRWLCSRMLGLPGVERLLVNPDRPGRREPRVIRRRMKEYNLMKRPRAELKTMGNWGENR